MIYTSLQNTRFHQISQLYFFLCQPTKGLFRPWIRFLSTQIVLPSQSQFESRNIIAFIKCLTQNLRNCPLKPRQSTFLNPPTQLILARCSLEKNTSLLHGVLFPFNKRHCFKISKNSIVSSQEFCNKNGNQYINTVNKQSLNFFFSFLIQHHDRIAS